MLWQEANESDFTPGAMKIWWEKLKHRGLFGGGRHALGWEDPGPEGAGGRRREREEQGGAAQRGAVAEEDLEGVRMFC